VINSRGDVLVTWADALAGGDSDERELPTRIVAAAMRPAGQSFHAPQVLDSTPRRLGPSGAPRPALADDGSALVVWVGVDGVTVARGTIAGGLSGEREVLPDTFRPVSFDAALSRSGRVAAVAIAGASLKTSISRDGGHFEAPAVVFDLSAPDSDYIPYVVIRVSTRRAAVAFVVQHEVGPSEDVYASTTGLVGR
jgi:hypothetical protein